ncbi:MAG TPA: acyl-CoA dehydrogenase family protein [Stellaceae bacterium]|nr:acyl-CoA dehydrogenase family protein [Stellaceae bacterium]
MPDSIITDTATKIFQDLCEADTVNKAEKGEWPTALWDALEESGLPLTWVSDEYGGAGAELADGFAVLRVAGRFAAPVPLAETLLAGWLLAEAKIAAPSGPMTVAPVYEDGNITVGADGKLSGRARQIPFARDAAHIAVMATRAGESVVALVEAKGLTIGPGTGLSGEPRDTVSFDGATAIDVQRAPGLDPAKLTLFAAAARAQQMAGALERILEQSVQYSLDRSQFGRPIAKFQAVQQNLAALAGEVAAASTAADGAAEAIAEHGMGSDITAAQVAIAKLRVGDAAGSGAAIAHQVHGAMGFTYEHTLHHSTRRLWSWREEFGNETLWAERLGRMVAAAGADALWPFVTRGS